MEIADNEGMREWTALLLSFFGPHGPHKPAGGGSPLPAPGGDWD